MPKEPENPGAEIVDIEEARMASLVQDLAALLGPARAAEMEAALLVGNGVLDGLEITERMADSAAGFEYDEWSPRTPLEFAEVAAFVRACPGLTTWCHEVGPKVLFILSVLSRPELEPLTHSTCARPPRRRGEQHFRALSGYEVFAIACLRPPAGVCEEERQQRYRRRLGLLEARLERALDLRIPIPQVEREVQRDIRLAVWALETAFARASVGT